MLNLRIKQADYNYLAEKFSVYKTKIPWLIKVLLLLPWGSCAWIFIGESRKTFKLSKATNQSNSSLVGGSSATTENDSF